MCIEHFGAVSAIEVLDKGVLIRLSRLAMADRNAFGRGLFGKGVGNHLRAVVQAYGVGRPIAIDQAAQDATQARRTEGHGDLDGQAFPIRLINYVQCPEPSFAEKRVVREVQRPTAIGFCGQILRLSRPFCSRLLLRRGKFKPISQYTR